MRLLIDHHPFLVCLTCLVWQAMEMVLSGSNMSAVDAERAGEHPMLRLIAYLHAVKDDSCGFHLCHEAH